MPISDGMLVTDSARLITSPWQRPRPPFAIDWQRAPRGLNTFVVFEGGARIFELVQDRQFTAVGPFNEAATPNGCGFNWTQVDTGLTTYYYTPVGPLFTGSGSQPSSFEIYFYWTSNSSPVVGLHDGTPASGTLDHQLGIGSSNTATWYIFDGSTTHADSSALTAPQLLHLVGVADGSTAKVYINGALAASVSASNSGFTGFTTPVFVIGSQETNVGTFNKSITATLLHAGFATVAWSADEVMDRYVNMYDFIVPVAGEAMIMLPPPTPPIMGQIWI